MLDFILKLEAINEGKGKKMKKVRSKFRPKKSASRKMNPKAGKALANKIKSLVSKMKKKKLKR